MFDDICGKILSPPKFKYSLYDLGSTFNKHGKRNDFVVFNKKNHRISCSLYQPHHVEHERACLIYLHSMNGSRLEGSLYSQRILKKGVSFCTFDFSGCGNSTGQKITFGANEKYDIQAVIQKLKEKFFLSKFILWGRSMGAVSAIKYSELVYEKSKSVPSYQKDEVVGLILDSSFKSLSKLLIEIGHTQSQLPRFLIQAGYFMIKNTLQTIGEFKISQLDIIPEDNQSEEDYQLYPLQKVRQLSLPILFLASKEDRTVSCSHSVDMFYSYKCNYKQLRFFRGLHNQSRQEDYMSEVEGFLDKILRNYLHLIGNKQQNIKICKESSHLSESGQINSYELKENTQVQKIETQPTHDKHQHTQNIISRPSIIKLIENQIIKDDKNDQNIAYVQLENIQSSCVCSMFQNSKEPVHALTKTPKQKEKIDLQKFDWAKRNTALQANFNCDRISLKDSVHSSQIKLPLVKVQPQSKTKYLPRHHIQPRDQLHINIQTQKILSPRMSENSNRIDRNMSLCLQKDNKVEPVKQHFHHNKVLDEIYKPLKVSSSTSLRLPLKQRLKIQ